MLFQEDNNHSRKTKQRVLFPLSEDEIDQILKGHVTAQADVGLQCAHGREGVSQASSTFENDNSLEIRLLDIVFFHDNDKAVMFDDLEDCFLFKKGLDYEIEEYELERDNMPEFESDFLIVKEFTANPQIIEAYSSLCLPINQQPIFLSDKNEGSTCIFAAGSLDKLVL